jgi:hypothetical protein
VGTYTTRGTLQFVGSDQHINDTHTIYAGGSLLISGSLTTTALTANVYGTLVVTGGSHVGLIVNVYTGGVLQFQPPNGATTPTFNINGGEMFLGIALSTAVITLQSGAVVVIDTDLSYATLLVSASTLYKTAGLFSSSPVTITDGGYVLVGSDSYTSNFYVNEGSLDFNNSQSYLVTGNFFVAAGSSVSISSNIAIGCLFNTSGSLMVNSTIGGTTFNIFSGSTTNVYGSVSGTTSFFVTGTLTMSATLTPSASLHAYSGSVVHLNGAISGLTATVDAGASVYVSSCSGCRFSIHLFIMTFTLALFPISFDSTKLLLGH